MIERKDGAIINMSSLPPASKCAEPLRYGVSKAAVLGLTKAVAADYVAHNIRCNAICPGTVDSPTLQERLRAQGDYEKARAAFVARQPIGRIGEPKRLPISRSIWPVPPIHPVMPSPSMAAGPSEFTHQKDIDMKLLRYGRDRFRTPRTG